MMWWLENLVYWLNYGCKQATNGGGWEWVRPCPAEPICSWLKNLFDEKEYCPASTKYKQPSS